MKFRTAVLKSLLWFQELAGFRAGFRVKGLGV